MRRSEWVGTVAVIVGLAAWILVLVALYPWGDLSGAWTVVLAVWIMAINFGLSYWGINTWVSRWSGWYYSDEDRAAESRHRHMRKIERWKARGWM